MYGTIAGWRTFAAERGNLAPTDASDADATAALVRASDYIRRRYILRSSYTGTEDVVEEATYIAADLELSSAGYWLKVVTPGESKVLTEVKGIKWTPVSVSVGFGSGVMQRVSVDIEQLLLPTSYDGMPSLMVV